MKYYEGIPEENSLDSMDGIEKQDEEYIEENYRYVERLLTTGVDIMEENEYILSSTFEKVKGMVKEIETLEEFNEAVSVIDHNIEGIETITGTPIDFFDPESLRKFLDSLALYLTKNKMTFLEEVKGRPEKNTDVFLWSVEMLRISNGETALEYNYPSRIISDETFSSRLIAKLCVNQLRKKGLLDDDSEKIIMSALPAYRKGNVDGFSTSNKLDKVMDDIREQSNKSLDEFFALPNSKEISEEVNEVYKKLLEIVKYRNSWKDGSKGLNPDIVLDDEIKRIVLETQEVEPFDGFWGHRFNYETHNLTTLINPPESK